MTTKKVTHSHVLFTQLEIHAISTLINAYMFMNFALY